MASDECAACKATLTAKADRCPRCGVPQGDRLQQAMDKMEEQEKGCAPHSYRDYDE
jgi:rRNA maturation endonuclease Nob1